MDEIKSGKPKISVFQGCQVDSELEEILYFLCITREKANELNFNQNFRGFLGYYVITNDELKLLENDFDIVYCPLKNNVTIYSDERRYRFWDEEHEKPLSDAFYHKMVGETLLDVDEKQDVHRKQLYKSIVNIYIDENSYYLNGTQAYYLGFQREANSTKYYRLTNEEYDQLKNDERLELQYSKLSPGLIVKYSTK